MTFTFLAIFCPNNFSFILGFSLKKKLNDSIRFALVLTVWIHFPSYFQCFGSGHVCVSGRDCQDNRIGVADELKDELSYLKFNVLRLITDRHLEKKTIWNCSKLCLHACMRLGVQEPRAQLAEWGMCMCMGRERSHLVIFMSQKIIPYVT